MQTKQVKIRPAIERALESEEEDVTADLATFPGSIKMPLMSVSEENAWHALRPKRDRDVLMDVAACMFYLPRMHRKLDHLMRRVKDDSNQISKNTVVCEVSFQ